MSRQFRSEKALNQFDVIPVDSNRDGPAEQFHRYHQALIGALTHEDSFDAVKGSTPDAHALPCTDEGMRVTRNVLMERCAKTLDLFIRDRCSFASRSPRIQALQAFAILLAALRWSVRFERRHSS